MVEDTPTAQARLPRRSPRRRKRTARPRRDFVDIFDDSSIVTVQVPDTWTQIDGASVTTSDGVLSSTAVAAPSPDLEDFRSTAWNDAQGCLHSGLPRTCSQPHPVLPSALGAGQPRPRCDDGETDVYDDGVYVGQLPPACPTAAVSVPSSWSVAAMDVDQTQIVVVAIQMVSDEDKTTDPGRRSSPRSWRCSRALPLDRSSTASATTGRSWWRAGLGRWMLRRS